MEQNPYEDNLKKPLEKYGRDIVSLARDGKIEPVIKITQFLLENRVLVKLQLLKA